MPSPTTTTPARPTTVIGVTTRSHAGKPAGVEGISSGSVVVSDHLRRGTLTAMADLVAKADAQLAIFRRTLEESARVERLSRDRATHLSDSLDASVRIIEVLDAKLVKARSTEQLLDSARQALDGLSTLVNQVRAGRGELDELIARHAAARKAELERSLTDQHAEIGEALARQRAALDQRLDEARVEAGHAAEEVAALVRSAKDEAQAVVAGLEEALKSDAGRLSQLMSQRADNVRARLEESLTRGEERLDEIRRKAEDLSTAGLDRAKEVCDRAERLLGVREGEGEDTEPRRGSLRAAIHEGESLISRVDETVLRLAVLADNGDQIREGVEQAMRRAESLSDEHRQQSRMLEEAIAQGTRAAQEVKQSLDESAQQTGEALARADHAAATVRDLSALVASLEAMAKQQAERARAAEASIDAAVARAEQAAKSLNRCLDHVTTQAGDLVGLAKDIAQLIERGETLRNGAMVTVVDDVSGDSEESRQAA